MAIDFFTVLISVFALILLGVPAFIARKLKKLKSESTNTLSFLLIYITQPFLILMCFDTISVNEIVWADMGYVIALAAFMHICMLLIGKLVFLKSKSATRAQKGVLAFAAAFSNCGYIGIPVVRAIFSQHPQLSVMLIYVTMYLVVFNIINWTIGVYFISGDKKHISLKNALINPTTITLAVALPMFFMQFNLSAFSLPIADSFRLIGDMTTPLSMLILGIKLADIKIISLFNEVSVYVSAILKLLLMPLITLIILKLTGAPAHITAVMFIITAMPTATLTVANAENFGGDSTLATKVTLSSTIISIITLPILSFLL